jgi:hypothetical protein
MKPKQRKLYYLGKTMFICPTIFIKKTVQYHYNKLMLKLAGPKNV